MISSIDSFALYILGFEGGTHMILLVRY